MTKGKVAAVRGPVIDVTFAHGTLPKINDALLRRPTARRM